MRDATTGKEISRMTYDTAVVTVAFSPDGKYGVSIGALPPACGYIVLLIAEHWIEDYNTTRPHEALQGLSPRQYAIQNA